MFWVNVIRTVMRNPEFFCHFFRCEGFESFFDAKRERFYIGVRGIHIFAERLR